MRLVLAIILAAAARGQQPPARPAFEVADIRPTDRTFDLKAKPLLLPGGRTEFRGITVRSLIATAYGVQENMIAGAPKWTENSRFDIVAKGAPNSDVPTLRLMLQSLLADRFKLASHSEDKVMSAYALTVGKRPSKLREASGGVQGCSWLESKDAAARRRECHNMTMTELAKQLPGWGGIGIELPVVDQTGLQGAYDFQLEVGFTGFLKKAGGSSDAEIKIQNFDSGPTIFAALEQIGLKLETRRMPIPVMVVDHVEPPGEN
jgi:uncharacterized protein (TIGR03435 family)